MAPAREQQYLSTCPSCDTQIDVTSLEPFTKLKCLHCGEMVRVRRKFEAMDASFDRIETVYGMGYRWNPESALP